MPEINDLTRLRMVLMLRRQRYWWNCEAHRTAQLHRDALAARSQDARTYWLHVSIAAAGTVAAITERGMVLRQGLSLAESNRLYEIEKATPWAELNTYDLATSMSVLEAFDEEMLTRV